MMVADVVDENWQAIQASIDRHVAKGLRWAATSNAGLPDGKVRLTFLPESAFREPHDAG